MDHLTFHHGEYLPQNPLNFIYTPFQMKIVSQKWYFEFSTKKIFLILQKLTKKVFC